VSPEEFMARRRAALAKRKPAAGEATTPAAADAPAAAPAATPEAPADAPAAE